MADPIALPRARRREPTRRLSYLDDPRVFFAAERTLLAWQRTAAALIGLALVIERCEKPASRRAAIASALSLLVAGAAAALLSLRQYRCLVRALSEPEVPRGHLTWPASIINLLLAISAFVTASWMLTSE